jgi:hypothetical protein
MLEFIFSGCVQACQLVSIWSPFNLGCNRILYQFIYSLSWYIDALRVYSRKRRTPNTTICWPIETWDDHKHLLTWGAVPWTKKQEALRFRCWDTSVSRPITVWNHSRPRFNVPSRPVTVVVVPGSQRHSDQLGPILEWKGSIGARPCAVSHHLRLSHGILCSQTRTRVSTQPHACCESARSIISFLPHTTTLSNHRCCCENNQMPLMKRRSSAHFGRRRPDFPDIIYVQIWFRSKGKEGSVPSSSRAARPGMHL